MAATIRELVTRSLARIGIPGTNQPVPAHMAQRTLAALNAMMAAWMAFGLSYQHATLTLDDSWTLGDEYEEAIISMLALRMTDDYAPEAATPMLKDEARTGKSLIFQNLLDRPVSHNDLPRSSRR